MAGTKHHKEYCIWQWNCRGFRAKRGNLWQYLNTLTPAEPDIIALQESGGLAKLSGYRSFSADLPGMKQILVTTLVKRNIPAIQHHTGVDTVEHVLLELLSDRKRGGGSLFILNVYSSPSKHHNFAQLFRKTLDIAKKQTLLIVGDFNSPHSAWGYKKDTKKADFYGRKPSN